jgi:hypothetical protein
MTMHICYVLHFVTEWNKEKDYYGMTEVKYGQKKQRAGDIRKRYHVSHPLRCMSGAVVDSLYLEPLGHLMTKENCLLQEAINTAFAMQHDTSVRGACYSCETIGAFLRSSAAQVRRVVGRKSGQEARNALNTYVSTLDQEHPLSRHVHGKGYKDPTDTNQIVLPTKYRTNASGKCGSKTRRGQLGRGEYLDGSERHKVLKRGIDPVQTVASENARSPVPRQSGRKRQRLR